MENRPGYVLMLREEGPEEEEIGRILLSGQRQYVYLGGNAACSGARMLPFSET